ncbi:MAG: hypothetical protein F4160_12405 [Rhodospirillaceae bacterium]|nr:hypothetical protein [Rhodospirillaceae bacterium]MDE0619749.1 hypothetical protein [Rhodospirillaceae bacterium]MXY39475.1 hypothetical protein [Rhodospirillaceae bacterium]MYH37582.1 hypothetical protein [Rhodospirillaceae bacterium]
MHRLSSAFVLGYHGCDKAVAEALLSGEEFKTSKNVYDWLGNGIYFWEANPVRGLEFAGELMNSSRGLNVTEPAVVGAVVDLGLCLDLMTSAGVRQVEEAHKVFVKICETAEVELPKNSSDEDKLRRPLDRAVFEQLHDIRKEAGDSSIDTVRGVFVEGDPVYEGAGFNKKTHIQICVRNPLNIKGVFRVSGDQLS